MHPPTGAEPSNHGGVDAALQAYLQECCCEGRRRCGRSPNAIGTTLAIERTEELNFDTLIPKTNAIAEGFVAPGDEPTADLLTGSLSPRKSSGNREWRRRSSASSEESNARTHRSRPTILQAQKLAFTARAAARQMLTRWEFRST